MKVNLKGSAMIMKLNPNCSEVVFRLASKDREQIVKDLEAIGIFEVKIRDSDLYSWMKDKEYKVNGEEIPEEDRMLDMLLDVDNPNIPDFKHSATIGIDESWHRDYVEDKTYGIQANQHCQRQLFPTMKKIEDNIGEGKVKWNGYDGGSVREYKRYKADVEEGYDDNENYQDKDGKKLREILLEKLKSEGKDLTPFYPTDE